MNKNHIIKEACVETFEEAVHAENLGAHQIELCRALQIDGLTPYKKIIKKSFEKINIPIKVMIRPRAGDFRYSHTEIECMLKDIELCAEIGVKDIVIGLLDSHQNIDTKNLEKIIKLFPELSYCFHKAIDLSPDIMKEIDILKEFPQFRNILSSGQADTAWNGREILKQMLILCGKQIDLIVAGGVTNKNLPLLHKEIGARYYHGRKIVGNLS